jgi:hypothetical protein
MRETRRATRPVVVEEVGDVHAEAELRVVGNSTVWDPSALDTRT